jgi:hypothetical protein
MTTLDALRAQIDLYQYHRGDAKRLLAASQAPRKTLGGVLMVQGRRDGGMINLYDHPAKIEDYLRSSTMAAVSLENAQTVFVADWVVDTLADAVDTFPTEYAPHLAEMPFDNGFAYLGRPVELRTRPNFVIDVHAISWVRNGSTVLIALYGMSSNAHVVGQAMEVKSAYVMKLGDPIEEALARLTVNEGTWYEVNGDLITPTAVDSEDIILRAVDRPSGYEERPGRDYQVRWVVRGHWAKRWVGKMDGSEERRLVPRWISAYVKGPADAPLISPIKLFAVSR